jgi:hypothetical protein
MSVDTEIRGLIRTALGMPPDSVRPANRNAPTGTSTDLFATVLISENGAIGWDSSTTADDAAPAVTATETVQGVRKLTATVQFFRPGANALARRLVARLQSAAAIELMQAAGLGLTHVGPVKDISSVVDTYWEDRAWLVLEFTATAVETATVDTYNVFPVTVTTGPESITFEVTAP